MFFRWSTLLMMAIITLAINVYGDEETILISSLSSSYNNPPDPGHRHLHVNNNHNNPPDPGHRNFHNNNHNKQGPPDPGHRDFNSHDRNNPPEPGQNEFNGNRNRNNGPPEPGQNNFNQMQGDQPIGPGHNDYRSNRDHSQPPEPGQNFLTPHGSDHHHNHHNHDVRRDGPYTDPILPPNYDRNYDRDIRRDSPSTDPIISPNYDRNYDRDIRKDSPSTDPIVSPNYDRNYDRDIRRDSPSTNPILPPNSYDRDIRRDSPSTNPILPPNSYDRDIRRDSPSTGPVYGSNQFDINRAVGFGGLQGDDPNPIGPGETSFRPRNREIVINPIDPGSNRFQPNNRMTFVEPIEPGRKRFPPNPIIINPIDPNQNRFRPNENWDRTRPYWDCDMKVDNCRLENRVNFVPFNKDYFLGQPALVLDIDEAARIYNSLPRLNPVKSYNAGRLVTREYFPAQTNRQYACLHLSYAWSGPENKQMHVLQRNKDDKCIYSSQSRPNEGPEWKDVELQLDLSGGDSTFLLEFSFDMPNYRNQIGSGSPIGSIPTGSSRPNRLRRQTIGFNADRSIDITSYQQHGSKIAIRDFKIGYGLCYNNQAFECDLPI